MPDAHIMIPPRWLSPLMPPLQCSTPGAILAFAEDFSLKIIIQPTSGKATSCAESPHRPYLNIHLVRRWEFDTCFWQDGSNSPWLFDEVNFVR